ncbi:hypothetical protein [Actinokineospora inagensis]|uniref:hypothetical protein n=1 Tax=Actinokineospora inagensis TaxID=103730 RepID=UPI0004791667|nr:hypothetical protein [Actinokineospora inagensis]
MDNEDLLDRELRSLRKGLGVHQVALPRAAGPVLRELSGVRAGDPPGVVRDRVIATVRDLVGRLAPGWRELAGVVFGLDNPGNSGYLNRLAGYGRVAERDVRTIQRRANQVVRLVAELAYAAEVPVIDAGVPWHTKRLAVQVALRGDHVEMFETRRIVSHRPNLVDVEHAVSVGRSAPGDGPVDLAALGIDEIAGGAVLAPRMVSADRVAFRLRPPRPLGVGDEHDFFFRVRAPVMAPYCCCTPQFACDLFTVNVRFEPGHRPPRAWRIDGVLSREVADPVAERPDLLVDSTGEVRAEFTNLRPALSYGIGWA